MILYRVFVACYAFLWSFPFALAAFVAGLPVASLLQEHFWLDDDWGLLMLPVGAAIGIWFGIASRHWRILHWVSMPLGVACAAWAYMESQRLHRISQGITGVDGPLSGLAEAIGSLLFLVLAVTALLVAASGFAGVLIQWQTPRTE